MMDTIQEEAQFDFVVTELNYVVERVRPPDWKVNTANPNWHNLVFAIDGKSHYHIDGTPYQVRQGDLLFFPRGLYHYAHTDLTEPWSYYSVLFRLQFADPKQEEQLQQLNNFSRGINYSQLLGAYRTLYSAWTAKQVGYRVQCRIQTMEILHMVIAHSMQQRIAHSQEIGEVILLITTNMQLNYTIDQLSRHVGLSASYLRLLFKKATGTSVIQYQNQIKMSRARDLLISGECNVTEAAQNVGFHDIYYFSKLFKKICGQSPSSFLKK